ncbi:MAG: hydroxymethylbilane synthase [Spartobacteria bacterium]
MLGSRGSELALAQTKLVEQALRKAWPSLEISVEIIRTSGDEKSARVTDRKAGRKGLFTREIEQELLVRRIDLAVHSAKDLPSEKLEELEIAATLPRANVEDVLLTRISGGLAAIAAGGVIGTGSIRRQRQLAWKRPDLVAVDLRGNVPTRLRKLDQNIDWSGIILARAGLERLGLEVVGRALRLPNGPGQPERSPYNAEILSPDDFVPAGGQGIIALQVRRDDERVRRLVQPVDDPSTHICLTAEREFLRLLNGDCDSPVGVHAIVTDGTLRLHAQVFEDHTPSPRMGEVTGATTEPGALAAALRAQLYGN